MNLIKIYILLFILLILCSIFLLISYYNFSIYTPNSDNWIFFLMLTLVLIVAFLLILIFHLRVSIILLSGLEL